MTKILKTYLILILFTQSLFSSFEPKPTGVYQLGLSAAGIASLNSGSFNGYLNPASMQGINGLKINLFYRNFYEIKELNQIALYGQFELFKQNFGLTVNRYGNNLYSEIDVVLSFAQPIIENFSAGVSVHMFLLDIQNYGNTSAVGLDVGLLYQPEDFLHVGFTLNQINEPELGESGESVPLSAQLGVTFLPYETVEIVIDLFKQQHFSTETRAGIIFEAIPGLQFLFGFRDLENTFSGGLIFEYNAYSLGYALEYHPDLNVSHSIGIGYNLD